MKKLWIGILFVIIVAFAVLFVVNRTKQESNEINIGVILPLSGPNAQYGVWTKEGMEIAIEEANFEYPKSNFKLIIEDDEAKPEKTVNAFNKLIKYNKVCVVTGIIASQLALAVAPIAEKEKIVMLSTGASSEKLKEAGDYIFRIREGSKMHGERAAEIALSISKSSAVIFINAENGISYADEYKIYYESAGGKIKIWEGYNEGEKDFRSYLTKAKLNNIQVIYIPGLVSEIALILKQAKEIGMKVTFISSVGAQNPKLLEIAKDAAEGLIYTYPSFDPSYKYSNDKVKVFVEKYINKYGHDPDFLAANGYDAIKILTQIIAKNEYTSLAIKNGLYSIKEYNGLSGKMYFDEDGEVVKSVIEKIVKNQQFQVKQ